MASGTSAADAVATSGSPTPLVSSLGAPALFVPPSAPTSTPEPSAQPSLFEALASLAVGQQQMNLLFQGMQRQMVEVCMRLTAVEGGTSQPMPPALPYSSPLLLPYRMPSYGGIPAQPPTVSEILSSPALSAPLLPTTSQGLSNSAAATSIVSVGTPALPGLPIHQIPFPHSLSPVPTLSSILHGPIYSSSTTVHEASLQPQGSQQIEGDSERHGVPKFHKLSFPLYDGKEDPLGWLNRCESFFRGQLRREADKVWLASFHMTGDAQQWYFILERNHGRPAWPAFRLLCQQRFGSALSTNHLTDLARLPFTNNVDTYMSAFQARLAHAGCLDPIQQAQLFTGGLPEHIRVDVELHEPQDLHRAMRLARAYERRNAPKVLALPGAPPRPTRRPPSG